MVSSHASQVRALRQRLHDLQRAGLTHLPRADAPSVDPDAVSYTHLTLPTKA